MTVKSQYWLITNTASWQPAYVSSHVNFDLFPCKVSCAMNGKFRGCLSFPAEVGVLSSRALLRCLFNLPFRHCWSWKLCPLLKTVLVVITPRRTKVFLRRFCSGITRLRSATRARALSPSLRARASPVTDVGSQHAHTLPRKNERRA